VVAQDGTIPAGEEGGRFAAERDLTQVPHRVDAAVKADEVTGWEASQDRITVDAGGNELGSGHSTPLGAGDHRDPLVAQAENAHFGARAEELDSVRLRRRGIRGIWSNPTGGVARVLWNTRFGPQPQACTKNEL